MNNLYHLTIHAAHQLLLTREITSSELTQAFVERIDAVEGRVKAFVTVTKEVAWEQAYRADERLTARGSTPLTGMPMQIKDVMCTRGIRTTCSSRMLEEFVPTYDATVVEKLYSQDAVLLGKGNMDEFAMGSSTESSAFFPSRNPWDLERVPGGSSGGGAAAVAAEEAIYALGSDTGGSIRQPASFCGVVGMKPTYGLVSRFGLIAYASSLDQIGPITKDVTDCALVLNTITGHDPKDSTSIPYQVPDYTHALTGDIKGLRIGVPKEYFVEGMEAKVKSGLMSAISVLQDLGASLGGGLPAHHALRPGMLLHSRPIGVLRQSGKVRWGKVRLLIPGHGEHVGGHGEDSTARLRTRSEAPHHAGHLRSVRRLL